MRVQNEIDRFHLVKDALQHLPQLGNKGAYLIQQMTTSWLLIKTTSTKLARICLRSSTGSGICLRTSNLF